MKRTVLLATSTFGEFDPAPVDRLRSAGFDCVRNPHGRSLTTEELVALMGDAVAVVAGTESYARAVLERLPRLRVLSRCGAGTDNVDLAAATERGVRVFSTPSAPAPAVAELTLGLILALLRQIPQSDAEVRSGRFSKKMGFLVSEKVYGIVGLGRVGRRVASLLRNLGATVLGNDIAPDREWAKAAGVRLVGRSAAFTEVDVVSLHVPFDPSLRHLVGADTLGSMRKGSYVINASRGGLVDEDALADALRTGRLAGAALDVYEREPYRGPLTGLPSVVLTPHIGSYARASRVAMEMEAVDHLIGAFSAGDV